MCSHLDQEPARQLDPCDVSEAGTLTDGHGISRPSSGEVQPEGQKNTIKTEDVFNSWTLIIYSFYTIPKVTDYKKCFEFINHLK